MADTYIDYYIAKVQWITERHYERSTWGLVKCVPGEEPQLLPGLYSRRLVRQKLKELQAEQAHKLESPPTLTVPTDPTAS